MRILIACEKYGRVRDAFRAKGHNAWSCDLAITPDKFHITADHDLHIFDIIDEGNWDMIIAFPPCTHLAVSGARWFVEKRRNGRQAEAIRFFMAIANAQCDKIAIENPIGIMSTEWRKPDQIIHPWQFGHGETKATCLWLKGLPKLKSTNIVEGREARIHRMSPGPKRGELRSITYQGIADAMAEQWG